MAQAAVGTPTRGAVLVTGAASGIGQAVARQLTELGFRVFSGARRPEIGAPSQPAAPTRLTPIPLDVTDTGAIRAAVETIAAEVGPAGLAGLVNNAGLTVPGPLEFLPLDELRRHLDVNVVGHLAVTQMALPLLRAGGGRIVTIGSLSGQVALPFYGAYAASKFATEALTDALRVELRPWPVRVILVEPGIVATPIWEKALTAGDRWLAQADPTVTVRYGRAMVGVRAHARRLAGAAFPPTIVARAVGEALTARWPRARYRVAYTPQLRALLLLNRLPAWLRDGIIARTLPRYP